MPSSGGYRRPESFRHHTAAAIADAIGLLPHRARLAGITSLVIRSSIIVSSSEQQAAAQIAARQADHWLIEAAMKDLGADNWRYFSVGRRDATPGLVQTPVETIDISCRGNVGPPHR
jgi:hypothetical protein